MSARPQVTITLGRSGQVVKRARPSTDADRSDDTGGKRPVRERLGSNVDDSNLYSSQYKNKRQRMDGGSSFRDGNLNGDKQFISNRRIGRDDLRLKLMNKTWRKNVNTDKPNGVDLREKLSRNTQSLLRYDSRQGVRESRTTGDARRIPPTRSADDLLQLDSLRKTYSSWTTDGMRRHRSPDLRRRSPNRLPGACRVLAPPRNYDELRHVSSYRSIDASRPSSIMTECVVDASRPEPYVSKEAAPRSEPYRSKAAASIDAIKPVVRAPPPGGIVQKTPFTSEEPLTVSSLLHSLGLGKYAILFQAEEVDMTALRQMGDHDLKELGIPMGPRKKILLAVLSHPKRRR